MSTWPRPPWRDLLGGGAAAPPLAAASRCGRRAPWRETSSGPNGGAEGTDWDAAIEEVDARDLVASRRPWRINGWLGPRWARPGWFHAYRLLADAIVEPARKQRVDADLARLQAGDYRGAVERINLERDLVGALTAGCRNFVAGYTVKREYFNAEFSAGIENIGFDALEGLNSPIFLRTVKLKDFPWNGWLRSASTRGRQAAWNPDRGLHRRVRAADVVRLGDAGRDTVALRGGLDAQPHLGCRADAAPMNAAERCRCLAFRSSLRRCMLALPSGRPLRNVRLRARRAELTSTSRSRRDRWRRTCA